MENKQKKLLEFFEIIDKPTWMIQLRDIIKSRKLDIWALDLNELSQEYIKKARAENNINKLATAMLICSIILKHKARRLGLNELEEFIEDEIDEVKEELPKEEIMINKTKQISLGEFTKQLNKILGIKNHYQKYDKKSIEILIPHTKEDFKTTGLKLLEFFQKNKDIEFDYETLKQNNHLENNLMMTLLYLNDDDKIRLKQKEMYTPLKIKIRNR